MSSTSKSPSQDEKSPPPSRWKEFYAGGVGALLAGVFSLGVAFWNGESESERQRCETAVQIVTDDQLNQSLNPAEQRSILMEARQTLRTCQK